MATKRALYEKVQQKSADFQEQATKKHCLMTDILLEEMDKDEKNNESWSNDSIVDDFLGRSGISLRADGYKPASRLEDFKEEWQKRLLMDKCEQIYNARMRSIGTQVRDNGTLTSFTSGSAARPWDELGLGVPSLVPDIALSDIVSQVNISTNLNGRIPEYNMPSIAEMMVDIQEAGQIPTFTIKRGERTVTMKKAGIGLEASEELLSSDAGADTVLEWVARVTIRQEMALVTAGLHQVFNGFAVTSTGHAFDSIDFALQDVAGAFSNGQNADIVIGEKENIFTYIKGAAKIGVVDSAPIGDTAVSRIIPQVVLGNNTARVTRAFYVDSNTPIGMQSTDLGLMDSLNTLGMLQYRGGNYDRNDFDVSRAVARRFLAMWYGFYVRTDGPRKVFR